MLSVNSRRLAAALAVAAAAAAAPPPQVNNRPIVAILTLPVDLPDNPPGTTSYFPASYVKFVEAAGARVVPLRYDAPPSATAALLSRVNGVVFTGGAAAFFRADGELSQYGATAKAAFDATVAAAAAGEWFPLHGTCLGFELVMTLAANNASVLSHKFDSENLLLPLELTPDAAASRLFAGAPPSVLATLGGAPSTANMHTSAVTPADFAANPGVATRFRVLSTNVDRGGRRFVSTAEAPDMPVTATQWHPEKATWEWTTTEDLPHDAAGVLANQWVSAFFGGEVRRSTRAYPNATLEAAELIYNYPATYVHSTNFEQVYFFSPQ